MSRKGTLWTDRDKVRLVHLFWTRVLTGRNFSWRTIGRIMGRTARSCEIHAGRMGMVKGRCSLEAWGRQVVRE